MADSSSLVLSDAAIPVYLLLVHCLVFYPREATHKRGLFFCQKMAEWLDARHTPLLSLNGKTYLKTFSTF